MDNNKQNSVEWLFNKLVLMNPNILRFGDYLEQAVAMHKEEITQAWKKGDGQFDEVAEKMSVEHYNETFGGNK